MPSSISQLSTSSQSPAPGTFNHDGPFASRPDFSGVTFNKPPGPQWQVGQGPSSGGPQPHLQQPGTGIMTTHGPMTPGHMHPQGLPPGAVLSGGIVSGAMGPTHMIHNGMPHGNMIPGAALRPGGHMVTGWFA